MQGAKNWMKPHLFYRDMTRKELAEADEEAPAEVVRHGLDPEVEKAIAVFKKHFRSVAEAFVYTNSDLRTGGITLVSLLRLPLSPSAAHFIPAERV